MAAAMVKYPNSTVSGPNPTFEIDGSTREQASDVGGVKLDEGQWSQLKQICEHFVLWHRHEKAAPDAAKMRKVVHKISRTAHKLNESLAELLAPPNTQEKDETRLEINKYLRKSEQTVESVWRATQQLEQASAGAEDSIKNKAGSKPGPQASDAKRRFIEKAAMIFKAVGGNPAIAYDTYKEENSGQFLDFMSVINDALPDGYRLAESKNQLGDLIKNYGVALKNETGKSLEDLN